MKKLFLLLLIASFVYIVFILSRVLFLGWKFSGSNRSQLSFKNFLEKDEVLRDILWLLPVVFLSFVLNSTFETNKYFKYLMCLLLFLQAFIL
jgi:hypothetical protein